MFTLLEQWNFMNENAIIDITLANLIQHAKFRGRFQYMFKIKNDGIDGELQFQIPADLPAFEVEVKRELRQYQIPHLLEMAQKHENYMVMAEKIFPTLKEELRANNINYVEAAGNIFIKTAKQTIWIDGNKYKALKKSGTNKAFTKTGLKTVFYLLLNEHAINLPYRKLAEATGVALGNINNVFEGLKEMGFILPLTKTTYKLQNKRALLERWITGYGETLRPTLFIGAYDFWDRNKLKDWQSLSFEKGETVWGGEPGSDLLTNYLKPEILTIYTREKTKLVIGWTIIPKEEGKLKVYEKFWKDEDLDQHPYAPPLLVYADLLLTNEPRCLETAKMVYDKYLKDEFEGN